VVNGETVHVLLSLSGNPVMAVLALGHSDRR